MELDANVLQLALSCNVKIPLKFLEPIGYITHYLLLVRVQHPTPPKKKNSSEFVDNKSGHITIFS